MTTPNPSRVTALLQRIAEEGDVMVKNFMMLAQHAEWGYGNVQDLEAIVTEAKALKGSDTERVTAEDVCDTILDRGAHR